MAIKIYKLTLLILVFSFSQRSFSDPLRQKSFGHNLSTTNDTLNKGQWTLGTYFIGAGLTDDITAGLSPWIALSYNLDNFIIKFKHLLSDEFTLSHQLAYFKTNNNFGTKYDQNSMSYWLTLGKKFSGYNFLANLNYMYFWNENAPFSLRREPFNNQAQQITLTTLHQFLYSDRVTLQFEVGVLGLNYAFPNLCGGASWLYYFKEAWSLQLGASFSKRFTTPDSYYTTTAYIQAYENYMQDSVHPEIQIQYWF